MKTPKQVLEILNKHNEANGWDLCEDDAAVLEVLREMPEVSRKQTGRSRWWTNYAVIVKVGGAFLKYYDAQSDDRTAQEAGWVFDPASVAEVVPVKEMVEVVKYVPRTT